MNNLFTLKTRVIFFSLLICQLGLKAQINTETKTASAGKTDTTLAKKGDTSYAIKADTSLAVKAGSTMIVKADTTLVINGAAKQTDPALSLKPDAATDKKADATLIANAENTLAKKADALLTANPDTSTVKKSDASINKTTIVAPPTDGVIEVKNASGSTEKGQVETKTTAGEIQVRDTTTSSFSLRSDSGSAHKAGNAVTKAQDPATTTARDISTTPAVTPPVVTPPVVTAPAAKDNAVAADKKADSALTVSADTTAKKADTTLNKKSDTTLVKRSDTTLVQKDTTAAVTEIKAQNLYLEVGGAGLAISANYDTRFGKTRNGWGYRVGLGFFTSGGNTVETVPFQVNYLLGQHSHMLELGAGTTFLNSTGTNVGNSKFEFDKVTGFIATATIGYRFQPAHKGINVRVAFVPILYDEGLIPAGGISVGYTFK